MRNIRKTAAACVLLVFGLTACADLDVVNPNSPDARRALASAGDVESLISGSFGQWWLQAMSISGPAPILANQSFMWSAWPANFGMVYYSSFPRIPVDNFSTHQFYGQMLDYSWGQNYRALSAVAQGLQAINDEETGIAADLGAASVARAKAFGKFMQGLATGSLALLYNEVFIIDEETDLTQEQTAVGYMDAMDVALGYFDDAIAAAGDMSGPIPASWVSVDVPPADFVKLIHSFKARYRANVARNPTERAAVNWQAVIDDVDDGIAGDGIGDAWDMNTGYFVSGFFNHYVAAYMSQPVTGWAQASYMIFGMADQDGKYQEWLADPPADRLPDLASGPFLIQTPDLRFPQGATEADQVDNPGIVHRETGDAHLSIGHKDWRLPARGTYRWSYYRSTHVDFHRTTSPNTATPEITRAEMNLLKAEGYIRMGGAANEATAAALINHTRMEAGLNDATLGNVDCVPKLPDGSCGNLMEMMKWEKRLETMVWGVHSVSWYFDGRGWGDLYQGTPVNLPVPCLDRELLAQECNTFGGVGQDGGAPISTYAYPHEG